MPRRDGIALGTTQERGVDTMEPNLDAQQRIVDACIKFYSAMRPLARGTTLHPTAQKPRGGGPGPARVDLPRDVPPVESFFGQES
jgi:hypothetical protein